MVMGFFAGAFQYIKCTTLERPDAIIIARGRVAAALEIYLQS